MPHWEAANGTSQWGLQFSSLPDNTALVLPFSSSTKSAANTYPISENLFCRNLLPHWKAAIQPITRVSETKCVKIAKECAVCVNPRQPEFCTFALVFCGRKRQKEKIQTPAWRSGVLLLCAGSARKITYQNSLTQWKIFYQPQSFFAVFCSFGQDTGP